MIFLFQRLIQNENQWVRPSGGRLGRKSEANYVKVNGFGHEDWNFNYDFEIEGHLYGFSYYVPAEKKRKEDYNLAFGIYKNKRWHLVGFYLNAKFVMESPIDDEIMSKKADDLIALENDLGEEWRKLSKSKKIKRLTKESDWLSWKVKAIDAIPTKEPIPISPSTYHSRNYRIANPTEISESTFNKLLKLNLKSIPNLEKRNTGEVEFPEGKLIQRKHFSRERNSQLIKTAKGEFKKKHGKLYCQICEFDFEEIYGEMGEDFIEGHHTIPISELTGKEKTKVKDIAMVCSNCHRMLHRKRPWLKMEELGKLIRKQ